MAGGSQLEVRNRYWAPETKWLGGLLLVTDEFCMAACRDGVGVARGDTCGRASPSGLMQWRMNMSGAQRRVARARAR